LTTIQAKEKVGIKMVYFLGLIKLTFYKLTIGLFASQGIYSLLRIKCFSYLDTWFQQLFFSWKSEADRDDAELSEDSNSESPEVKPDVAIDPAAKDLILSDSETDKKPILFFIHGNYFFILKHEWVQRKLS